MRKTLALLFVLLSFDAQAQTGTSYHFSDGLLKAAKDCAPYEEDFTPSFLAKIPMLDTIKTFIHIKGKNDKDFCDFSIDSQMAGIAVSSRNCSVSAEQLTEIRNAMTDNSSDIEINKVWHKISEAACKTETKELSEQDKEKIQQDMLALSPDFIENLRSCTPAREKKSNPFFLAEIKKQKGDFCRVDLPPFKLALSLKQRETVKTWKDLYSFTLDPVISRYEPEYMTIGLFAALKSCALDDKGYDSGKEKISFDNVTIAKGLSSAFNNGVCMVTFKNVLTRNEKETDHSKICKITKEELLRLLPSDIAKEKEENGFTISLPFSQEEQQLSKQLFEKLTADSRYCGK